MLLPNIREQISQKIDFIETYLSQVRGATLTHTDYIRIQELIDEIKKLCEE